MLSLYVVIIILVIGMTHLPLPIFSRRSPEVSLPPWLGLSLAWAQFVPVCSFRLFCASSQRFPTSAVSAIDDRIDLLCKE